MWYVQVRQGGLCHRCRRQHWGLRLPLLLSLRVDLASHGTASSAKEWHGAARHGAVRTADGSTEGSPSLLFSREQVWLGGTR